MFNEKETGAQGEIGGPAVLKVGGWVRVLPIVLELPPSGNAKERPWITPEMKALAGVALEVTAIEPSQYGRAVEVGGYWWLPEWLEAANPERAALPTPSSGEGPDLEAIEKAFRSGYSAGHASGSNEASWDSMRHNDSPDCDEAWKEFAAGTGLARQGKVGPGEAEPG